MLGNISLGLTIGGSLALSVILLAAQWARIRRGDLRMRSRWGFGFGELVVLFVGWSVIAALGVRVALDDFGTGFSSLGYLRDLPTHKIKLDRSFTQHTLTSRRCAAILQGVITMAHHMDMVVVAEGIETAEQRDDLVHRSCDMLQGFLFSHPLPLSELEQLPDRLSSLPVETAITTTM